MTDATDMDAPVTRRELREELQALEQRLDAKLAPYATKLDLEAWGFALVFAARRRGAPRQRKRR